MSSRTWQMLLWGGAFAMAAHGVRASRPRKQAPMAPRLAASPAIASSLVSDDSLEQAMGTIIDASIALSRDRTEHAGRSV